MVRPLFKGLKKYTGKEIHLLKSLMLLFLLINLFIYNVIQRVTDLCFVFLNICNYICGYFIIEMPVVLRNVRGMSFQHSGDLQCI